MSSETADLLKLVLTFVFSTGAGWVASLLRERRKIKAEKAQADKEEAAAEAERPGREDRAAIEITQQLQALASGAVERVSADLAVMQVELTRLRGRVTQLEDTLRENHIQIPPEIG